ncbi:DsbC family protein [Aurantiacibacter poecillastricola]|uniref:DsbC family protein n=1 Tax=Aurantiacibacter poecillastricola TaxID=3064385 RepID=UPI00273EDAEF|nr:DsbC family protein [Aurantiacibacter sp. 219JJ12-13]MDP5263558.1 DsbC family protein [Aurantiacibacter sp. 219JJ12-13]WBY18058.1 DsbC family protein [Erythrobacteraceae bacterium WH01K]
MNNQRILPASDGDSYRGGAKRVLQGLLILATGGGIAMGASALAQSSGPSVEKALAERLPKTEITAIDCEKIEGVCEVQARQNLFYIDHGARYLIIGRVYDMETKQDLTAARLLEMNPDMLIGGGGDTSSADPAQAPGQQGADTASVDDQVDPLALAALPQNGAVVMGRGARTITVFSDFRCGYCKRLHETLETLNVKVVERPISVLGTRPISEAVICSPDKRQAVNQAYDGGSITTGSDCDTSGLDANEAFARKHGFNGTPVIVREDGAVVHGFRPREFLESWIQGSAS